MTKSIHTDEMIALRDWLKSQRKAQNLTMRSLAHRIKKPHSFIQRIEDGERRLDVVEFVWYCTELGIDPHLGIDLILKLSLANQSQKN